MATWEAGQPPERVTLEATLPEVAEALLLHIFLSWEGAQTLHGTGQLSRRARVPLALHPSAPGAEALGRRRLGGPAGEHVLCSCSSAAARLRTARPSPSTGGLHRGSGPARAPRLREGGATKPVALRLGLACLRVAPPGVPR